MINWKVRLKNPVFWLNLALSIAAPLLAYFGLNANEITTWGALADLVAQAVKNPLVLVSVAMSVYNFIIDPTTQGLTDSMLALTYITPGK
jgi:holin, phage phi LC3 family